MTPFFITIDRRKCIAVSAVREATHRLVKAKHGNVSHWELRDENGVWLGDTYQDPMSMGPIIPGSGEAIVVSADCLEGRPTAADVYVRYLPIIGWRDEGYGPTPILPETPYQSCRVMFPLSDGSILEPDVTHWDSKEAMIDSVLAEAQDSWDRKHNSKTEQTP